MSIKRYLIPLLPALLLATPQSLAKGLAAKPTVDEILQEADRVRNPSNSYQMNVKVASSDGDEFVFQVSLKGNDKTLIETTKPASSAGKKYLMLQENMWVFTPKMGHPARISLSQKLTGLAANGDISRMRWSGDYAAKLEKDDGKSWQLLLTARKKDLTYDKLRIWVAQSNYRPIKAEFLTPKGDILKTATYGGYKQLVGQMRPTEMVISDPSSSAKSTLTIIDMTSREFPDSMFNQNALK